MSNADSDNQAITRRFYSVKQAALLLGVSEKTIYKAIQKGDLPSVRVSRTLRIPQLALDPARGSVLGEGRVLAPEAE